MPATFDLPLEQLRSYEGSSPRPDDFDVYWDRGIAEVAELGTDCELAPADIREPFARCENLWFHGVGGARVHAQLLRPTTQTRPGPALLIFHPYATSAGAWSEKLHWVAAGFSIAALDVRGQGGLSEDPIPVRGNTLRGHIVRGLDDGPDRLFYRSVFLDTLQLARIMMSLDEVNADAVGVTGMSQGGGLALACAALEPRIRMAAPIAPFLCDYRRVWDLDLAGEGYAELAEYLRRFDPYHERQPSMFERLGYIDVQHLCPRIRADVLMTIGLMDQICPPSTQFAAYNKIRSPKRLLLLLDYEHEVPPEHPDRLYAHLTRLRQIRNSEGLPSASPDSL